MTTVIVSGVIANKLFNGGAAWTDCTAGLPPIPKNAVVVDPANTNSVWVAADVGVYHSTNAGAAWAFTAMASPERSALK